MKKKLLSLLVFSIMLITSTAVFADAVVGDVIVCLGENLDQNEQQQMLNEFNVSGSSQIIYVSNSEEHQYLGGIVPAAQIGNRAISSVAIKYTKKGSGLKVKVNKNINYISETTYRNALTTAGVTDADIQVSSPYEVSGTAALTGLMKAYETSTGKPISDEVKKVANEEMVTTSDIGETIGDEKASALINEIKKQIGQQQPQSTEDVQNIINNIVNNNNIQISDAQMQELINLFDKMKGLDIDWNQVSNQISSYADKASAFLSSDQGQGFLEGLKNAISGFIDWFASLFR